MVDKIFVSYVLGNCNVKNGKNVIEWRYRFIGRLQSHACALNATKTPKKDTNVDIKILLKEIIHKFIRNEPEYEIYNHDLSIIKR